MRILFITHTNSLDGANRSLLQLVIELRSNHHAEPIIVCPRDKHSHVLTDVYSKANIKCIAMPLVWFKLAEHISPVRRLLLAISFLLHNLYLIYKLRNVRFDMVHSNTSVIDMGAYLAMWRGVPHVWHLREFGFEDFGMKSVLGRRYEQWIYKKCAYGIAISQAIARKYKPIFGKRLRLIYNGIAPKSELLQAAHNNDILTFCIVGRIEPNKNQMEVLKACQLLKHEHNCTFKLLVVGSGNVAYTEKLKKYVADNDLESNVIFTGFRNDIPEVLSKCDVGLTTSTNEAFGRITVEYMMQNLAVIASDNGANPEIINDGDTGLLYHLGEAKQLACKMHMLIADNELLQRLARNGRQYACKYFSSVKNSDSIYLLYKTLVKE